MSTGLALIVGGAIALALGVKLYSGKFLEDSPGPPEEYGADLAGVHQWRLLQLWCRDFLLPGLGLTAIVIGVVELVS